MNQSEFTRIYCERPEAFSWFLGAGASHNANLPTAEDIITDLKRRYYCSEENQKFATKDLQNIAVRQNVEAYLQSRGFPERWAPDEYTTYFETIFGDDRERQRTYISAILAEDRVRLAIGNRVFGALLSSGLCRLAFTTNFDPVVEKAVAEISGKPLAAFHLEGAHNAVSALNNEQFPIYCKLHGDFQYDSIKNLSADLATQNTDLSRCMTLAGTRFGFVVAGYSGRDNSVMSLFRHTLSMPNPFPHGLYWMKLKNSEPLECVASLIHEAQKAGVRAEFVDIETYDTVMLRIWRNLPSLPEEMDEKVRKGRAGAVQIALPDRTGGKPILRLSAVPITKTPEKCARVKLKSSPTWDSVSAAQRKADTRAILTFDGDVMAWGEDTDFESSFGSDFVSKEEMAFDPDWRTSSKLHLKRFLEDGLAQALCRERPLLMRRRGPGVFLIVDQKAQDVGLLQSLFSEVGRTTGVVPGLSIPESEHHPRVDKVHYAEAVRVSLGYADERMWLLLKPDVWIWPAFARQHATQFLDRRKADRRNDKHDRLLSAWVGILSDDAGRNVEVSVSPFDGAYSFANPEFAFSTQTGFAKKRGRQ